MILSFIEDFLNFYGIVEIARGSLIIRGPFTVIDLLVTVVLNNSLR